MCSKYKASAGQDPVCTIVLLVTQLATSYSASLYKALDGDKDGLSCRQYMYNHMYTCAMTQCRIANDLLSLTLQQKTYSTLYCSRCTHSMSNVWCGYLMVCHKPHAALPGITA